MKKILTIAIALLCLNAFISAQPYVSISANTKGFGMSAGYLSASNLDLSIGYDVPFRKADVPSIFYAKTGYQILLSNYDENNFSLTPSLGIANYKVKDFSHWDNEGGSVKDINEIKPIYGLELAKDWNAGRLFISANYCGNVYGSIGIRAFIK